MSAQPSVPDLARLLGALAALAVLACAGTSRAENADRFDIPAGPLSSAMLEFAVQARVSTSTGGAARCGPTTGGLVGRFRVREGLDRLLAGNGPIREVHHVDLRQSMANGGGPACLRLRVVADPATVDPRFLLDEPRVELIEGVVREFWPEQIDPSDIGSESLASAVIDARDRLLGALGLSELA